MSLRAQYHSAMARMEVVKAQVNSRYAALLDEQLTSALESVGAQAEASLAAQLDSALTDAKQQLEKEEASKNKGKRPEGAELRRARHALLAGLCAAVQAERVHQEESARVAMLEGEATTRGVASAAAEYISGKGEEEENEEEEEGEEEEGEEEEEEEEEEDGETDEEKDKKPARRSRDKKEASKSAAENKADAVVAAARITTRRPPVLDPSRAHALVSHLHVACAAALETIETDLIETQHEAAAHAYLFAEALRSRERAATRRDAIVARRDELVKLRRAKAAALQALFEQSEFSEEAKAALTAEKMLAADAASTANAELAAIEEAVETAKMPWVQLPEDAASAKDAGVPKPAAGGEAAAKDAVKAGVATSIALMLPSRIFDAVLELTGGSLQAEKLESALDSAMARVRSMDIFGMTAAARHAATCDALEVVTSEAMHLTALVGRRAITAKGATMPPASASAAGPMASSLVPSVAARADGDETLRVLSAALRPLLVQMLSAREEADADGRSASEWADSQLESEAGRALLQGAATSVVTAASAAQHRAIDDAWAVWEEERGKERELERSRGEQALAVAVQGVREEEARARAAAVQAMADDKDRMMQRGAQGLIDVAVADAIKRTTSACEAEAKRRIEQTAKEQFELGKAAVGRSAERAVLAAAMQQAREMAKKEMGEELASVRAAEARAAKELVNLRAQMEAQVGELRLTNQQMMARAVPAQRMYAEAMVAEAVKAERTRAEESERVAVQLALERATSEAERRVQDAVVAAREAADASAIEKSRKLIEAAKAEARREEHLLVRAQAREELKTALETAAREATKARHEAVKAALESAAAHKTAEVAPQAVAAVIDKSEGRARSLEVAAEETLRRALEQAELRHRQQQRKAVHAAVTEAIGLRRKIEEGAIEAAVSAALDGAAQRAVVSKMKEIREAEGRVREEMQAKLAEEVKKTREEAEKEALERIQPQLQRQEAVEQAIRDAEARARERERQLAAQVQSRIEELAAEAHAAEQPKAVQAAVRAAVRESEERAEARVKAIHDAYEQAAAEQQAQIKALLREANARAQQQQDYAVSIAVAEALTAADEDKQVALEHARSAVHGATLQQQEQLDGLLGEIAQLRAENMRMLSDLQRFTGGEQTLSPQSQSPSPPPARGGAVQNGDGLDNDDASVDAAAPLPAPATRDEVVPAGGSAVEQTPTGRSEPQNAKMGAASREGNDDDGALAAAATVPARKLNLDLD